MTEVSKSTFEELYLEQKKKNSILMGLVIVLAITTIVGLSWGFSKSSTSSQNQVANMQVPNGQGFPGGAPGGSMGQMDFKRFFNDAGSVDTGAVQDMIDRLPSGAGSQFLERFTESINQAAEDGKIIQSQADELIKAFESAKGSNES